MKKNNLKASITSIKNDTTAIHGQFIHLFIFFTLCDLTLSTSSLDLAFIFQLYSLSWSQVMPPHPQPPTPALSCRETWISQLEIKMHWHRWLAVRRKQFRVMVPPKQTSSFLTHPMSTFSNIYPDENLTTVARPSPVWVSNLMVSLWESLQMG